MLPVISMTRLKDYLPAIVIALTGLTITYLLYDYFRAEEQAHIQAELEQESDVRANLITGAMREIEHALQAVQGLMAASEEVTQEEFDIFTEVLREGHLEIRSVVLALPLSAEGQGLDKDDPLAVGDMAISHVSPARHYQQLAGRKLASYVADRGALVRASKTHDWTVTAVSQLPYTPDKPMNLQFAFPLYQVPQAGGAAQRGRQQSLRGFLIVDVDLVQLIEMSIDSYLHEPVGLDFYIYQAAASDEQLLYFHPSRARQSAPSGADDQPVPFMPAPVGILLDGLHKLERQTIADQAWLFVFKPIEGSFADYNEASAWVAITSLLLTTLFVSYIILIKRRKREIQAEADASTEALQRSEIQYRTVLNVAVDGIIIIDAAGIVRSFNLAAERLFHYQADEVVGKNVNMLMPEPYRSAHDGYINNYKTSGVAKIIGTGREVQGQRKDGSLFDMNLAVSRMDVAGQLLFTGIVHDITAQKQAEQALRQSEERFRVTANAAQDAIIILDNDGNVNFWNEAAETIFGYKTSEMIGKNLHAIVVPERYLPDHRKGFQLFRETGHGPVVGKTTELTARSKNGREFPVEVGLSAVKIKGKWHAIGLVRDITERKEVEISLLEAKELAEHANQAKSRFVSHMSHELRTPLNAILGYAQLLDYGDELTDKQKRNVREIYNAGGHLLELVNDILELGRIEEGRLELSMGSVAVGTVVADCDSLIQPLAEQNLIQVAYELEGCRSASVIADPMRLRQVLLNLLSNAVKYNREGGGVTLSCVPQDERRLRLVVADTGRGMNSDQLSNLFQPFNRLGAEAGATEGSGIGLVITRELVELMGGAIGVESAVDQGTTVWVEFDCDTSGAVSDLREEDQAKTDTPVAQEKRTFKILLVEDNPVNRELLLQQLEMLGYRAEVSANGEEGLRAWQSGSYSLVLTDVNMPVMNGYQLCQAIRAAEHEGKLSRTPVVAISANARQDDVTRGDRAGMDDYVTKPVNLGELEKTLSKWLPWQAGEKPAVPRHMESCEANAAGGPGGDIPIDPDALTRLVGDDPLLHRRFLHKFVDTAPAIIQDVHQACSDRQAGTIGDLAHKLKSSARAVGATELADLCQSLEHAGRMNDWALVVELVPQLDGRMSAVSGYVDLLG